MRAFSLFAAMLFTAAPVLAQTIEEAPVREGEINPFLTREEALIPQSYSAKRYGNSGDSYEYKREYTGSHYYDFDRLMTPRRENKRSLSREPRSGVVLDQPDG